MVFRCMRLARLIGQGDADTWRNEYERIGYGNARCFRVAPMFTKKLGFGSDEKVCGFCDHSNNDD